MLLLKNNLGKKIGQVSVKSPSVLHKNTGCEKKHIESNKVSCTLE